MLPSIRHLSRNVADRLVVLNVGPSVYPLFRNHWILLRNCYVEIEEFYLLFFFTNSCESAVVLGSGKSKSGFLQPSKPGGNSPKGESKPKTVNNN